MHVPAAVGNANNDQNEVIKNVVITIPMQVDTAAQTHNDEVLDDQLDFIPMPDAEEQSPQGVHANIPVFVPANVSMDYEDAHIPGNVEPNNYMSDNISVLQDLIGNIVSNAHDIFPKLGGSKIVNAKCNIVDVEGTQGFSKKCYLQIMTVQDKPAPVNSASLTEISKEAFAEVCKLSGNKKRKKKAIVDEAFCRRSNRIAQINLGFKDKFAAEAAIGKAGTSNMQTTKQNKVSENMGNKADVAINLGPRFEAVVMDKNAPPPPMLSLETIQAIGTGPCKMAPHEVSSLAVNYDSSDG